MFTLAAACVSLMISSVSVTAFENQLSADKAMEGCRKAPLWMALIHLKASQVLDTNNDCAWEFAQVPSRVVLELGDAISGISRVLAQAARSIG